MAAALALAPPLVGPLEPDTAAKLNSAFLAGRNPRTLRAYSEDLADFSRFLGMANSTAALEVPLQHGHGRANALVLDYRSSLVDRGLASATVNRRLSAIRAAVKFARLRGVISWSLEVQGVKAERLRDVRGPGPAVVRAMREAAASRNDAVGRRDTAIMRLLSDLALRRFEISGLDREHVDLVNARVSVLRKGRRQRTSLELTPAAVEALRRWLEVRGEDAGPLFTCLDRAHRGQPLTAHGVWRIVRRLGAAVGVKTWVHAIRHTAITEVSKLAQQAGLPVERVLDFSGHSSISVLQLYLDRTNCQQAKLSRMASEVF